VIVAAGQIFLPCPFVFEGKELVDVGILVGMSFPGDPQSSIAVSVGPGAKLDDPSFPAPIFASLVKGMGDDSFTLNRWRALWGLYADCITAARRAAVLTMRCRVISCPNEQWRCSPRWVSRCSGPPLPTIPRHSHIRK